MTTSPTTLINNVARFTHVTTGTIGYPRIGQERQLKKALEAYWAGTIDQAQLHAVADRVERRNIADQLDAGIQRIGVGSFSLYDQVLDWAFRLGLIPSRFHDCGKKGLDLYFALARGIPGARALHMTKWFDTNYHYLVPEIEGPILSGHFTSEPDFTDFLKQLSLAEEVISSTGSKASRVPIVLGPLTFVKLCRYAPQGDKSQLAADFLVHHVLPKYIELFEKLVEAGVDEVYLQEPILVVDHHSHTLQLLSQALNALAQVGGIGIHLVTFFDDISSDTFKWLCSEAPKNLIGVSLDFTRGNNLNHIATNGFPQHLTLGAGLLDARNVWQIEVNEVWSKLATIRTKFEGKIVVQPSASLQHVPYDSRVETNLPIALRQVLSFARQKLNEVHFIASLVANQDRDEAALESQCKQIDDTWFAFHSTKPSDHVIRERVANLTDADLRRPEPFAQRKAQQVQLPLFYTTTIGSLPQTATMRGLRTKLQLGRITLAEYQAQVDLRIAHAIGLQEGMDLDVLVHGEFERTDMVEYFAQKIDGFSFSMNGWVQSYGSRCVRPPIIWGDLSRHQGHSMTVREFIVARSFTERPVKAMLTGPTTILNWSFPRSDITRREQALQLALILRDEIHDLTNQAGGARVVQVDEPALREGLPLNAARRADYLQWAVDSFRLATAGAPSSVQIVTHMCYAEFDDVMDAIDALDADVISIENSRNNDKTIKDLTSYGYARDIGPGVYDIHSPVVPSVDEIISKLRLFLLHLDPTRVVVNPDCGLKTRQWSEVVPSLTNMVAAARMLRAEYAGVKKEEAEGENKNRQKTRGEDAL